MYIAVCTVVDEDQIFRKPQKTLERKGRMVTVKNLREKGKGRPVGRKNILSTHVGCMRRKKTRKCLLINVWKFWREL